MAFLEIHATNLHAKLYDSSLIGVTCSDGTQKEIHTHTHTHTHTTNTKREYKGLKFKYIIKLEIRVFH